MPKILAPRMILSVSLVVLALFGGPSRGQAQTTEPAPKASATFHVATSDAEKALDHVLVLSGKHNNLLEFVLHTPAYKPKADKGYARYFTARLLTDMAAMEKKAVQKNCKGKYIKGELCGTDYNPLNCAQDDSELPYLYDTTSSAEGKAVITYKWQDGGTEEPLATFEMLQEGGEWKIDAVQCRP
ncbi:MAG: DUF3828 domain-containing protein [Solidesulfovibrio sp.]